jgi:uncharacterized DUF497 family protein
VRFEWDDQKALANLKKHGVSFGEATEVFYDPNALEDYDVGHSNDEADSSSSGCPAGDCYT